MRTLAAHREQLRATLVQKFQNPKLTQSLLERILQVDRIGANCFKSVLLDAVLAQAARRQDFAMTMTPNTNLTCCRCCCCDCAEWVCV
jgi:hypothetical protein